MHKFDAEHANVKATNDAKAKMILFLQNASMEQLDPGTPPPPSLPPITDQHSSTDGDGKITVGDWTELFDTMMANFGDMDTNNGDIINYNNCMRSDILYAWTPTTR